MNAPERDHYQFIIGLSEADIIRMRNGGHVHLDHKVDGPGDVEIVIGLSRSDADIDKAIEKYKDIPQVISIKQVNSDRGSSN
jgi:hypothetical protein